MKSWAEEKAAILGLLRLMKCDAAHSHDDGLISFKIEAETAGRSGICLLYRGKHVFPDNRVGACADCAAPVEHRPDFAADLTRRCAPCVLARVRGGQA